ncbi:MAG: hypothetical protein AABM33_13155 [Pseudomonadota bacterium]
MRLLLLTVLALVARNSIAQCTKDIDCKFDRICEKGTCIAPAQLRPSTKEPVTSTPKSEVGSQHALDAISQSLQEQLSCGGRPEPGKALRALRARAVIGKTPVMTIDGMHIFAVIKPLSVFGFKVLQVTGWEESSDKSLFSRGPGTAPPLNIQAIVEGDPQTVKREVEKKAGKAPLVSKESYTPHPKPTTSITCNERY